MKLNILDMLKRSGYLLIGMFMFLQLSLPVVVSASGNRNDDQNYDRCDDDRRDNFENEGFSQNQTSERSQNHPRNNDEDCKGKVKVSKKVNLLDGEGFVNGNSEEFGFAWGVDGVDNLPNRPMGSSAELDEGDYTIVENDVSGYQYVGWYYTEKDTEVHPSRRKSCSQNPRTGLPVVEVKEDREVKVTLCNKKVQTPTKLNLKKYVVNNNGGTIKANEWTLTATDGENTPINTTGVLDGDYARTGLTAVIPNTTYTLSETGPNGYYSNGNWSCWSDKQNQQDIVSRPAGNKIVLAPGASVTCMITNDDIAPQLNLKKQMIGGSASPADWTLSATSEQTSPINQKGEFLYEWEGKAYAGTGLKEVVANTEYTLTESDGPSNYAEKGWNCSADEDSAGSFSFNPYLDPNKLVLQPGAKVTCMVTNEYEQPEPECEVDCEPPVECPEVSLPSFALTQQQNEDCEQPEEPTDEICDTSSVLDFLSSDRSALRFESQIAVPTGSINGCKFYDANANGVWDEGEEVLSGFKFDLYSCSNSTEDINNGVCEDQEYLRSSTSNESGVFTFGNLVRGTYMVCETQVDGWTQSYPVDGSGNPACWLVPVTDEECIVNFGNTETTPGQVLGSSTPVSVPPVQVLANTGSSLTQSLLVAMTIIGLAGSSAIVSRRKIYQTNNLSY